MSFYLYSGNKLEKLGESLVSEVYLAGGDPMAAECVVVQNQGMAAWLKLFLGKHGHIAANLDTPFPGNFINGILGQLFPGTFAADSGDFSPNMMEWQLFRILENCPYREVDRYVNGEKSGLKRWQLAVQLAGLFDQYQIYRTGELAGWERGESLSAFDWQRKLYCDMLGNRHGRDWYLRKFFSLETLECVLPKRISIFGVGAMPPVFADVFLKLGEFTDVHFFYLNPCRKYWEHLYSGKEAVRILEEDEVPLEGNPLLASCCAYGREFLQYIYDKDVLNIELWDDFAPEGRGSTLELLQQDILDMEDRSANMTGEKPECDNSITVHSCHSCRREVEVLHDRLIGILESEEAQLRDILVMAPDINRYAPYIDAVFSCGPLRGLYAIADRGVRESGRVADAFLRLLRLSGSRFEVSEIMSFLDVAPLRKCAGIEEKDLPELVSFLKNSSVRWGYDSAEHRDICGSGFDDFSWEQGLDRLLMGFARMEPEDGADNGGIFGVECVEGDNCILLGNFINWLRRLVILRRELALRRSVFAWSDFFRRMLSDFFAADDENMEELSMIRSAAGALAAHAARADYRSELDIDTVRGIISDELGRLSGRFSPFLRGKITFCSMMPMRSIPMDVVAVLGLNDGEFPRKDFQAGFNIMSRRKRGDRSHQAEDRYLFLEAILSARKKLLLFYQGQSARGEEVTPPALPLGELTEYLKKCFDFRITVHKLQPFDFDYFCKEGRSRGLFSYSEADFKAGKTLAESLKNAPKAAARNVPVLSGYQLPERLELSRLVNFWKNPAEFFLSENMGMNFYDNSGDKLEDNEIFSFDHLYEYSLKEKIAVWMLNEFPPETQLKILRGRGLLPVGVRGDMEFDRLARIAGNMPESWQKRIRSREQIAVEAVCGACTVYGTAEVSGGEHILWRVSSFKSKAAAAALCEHLLLNIRYGSMPTLILTLDRGVFTQRRIEGMTQEEALEDMSGILEAFRTGLREPLPFFPDTSLAYRSMNGEREAVMKMLAVRFDDVSRKPFDGGNEAIRRFFRAGDFYNDGFFNRFSAYSHMIFSKISDGEVFHE